MASIYKDAHITASPEAGWDVVRDVGQVHTRFAPGWGQTWCWRRGREG